LKVKCFENPPSARARNRWAQAADIGQLDDQLLKKPIENHGRLK